MWVLGIPRRSYYPPSFQTTPWVRPESHKGGPKAWRQEDGQYMLPDTSPDAATIDLP